MNNNTKHTPAPWFACCNNTEAHYVFAGECDITICIPCQNDPSSENFEQLSGIVTKEQRLANARLIAAAPDMYEALIAQKEVDEWIENADPSDPFFEETLRQKLNHARDMRDEAITKAEGAFNEL